MIQCQGVQFHYPGEHALKDIHFELPERSITALVGPNGAGKTTLFRCLAGLTAPFAGSITVDGIDVVAHPRRAHERIAFLPDFFGLYEDLTLAQSLEYFARANGITRELLPERIQTTLEMVKLEHKAEAQAKELSRGMKQRLGIAQVLIAEPKVLLLDEPASGLDPEARIDLGNLLIDLKNQGLTLVVSSHILAELDQYADHLLILRHGELIRCESLEPQKSSQVEEKKLQRIFFRVLNPDPMVEAWGKLHPEASLRSLGDRSWEMHCVEGLEQRARLLKNLIEGGILPSDFHLVREDMQEQYLRLIRKEAP